MIRVALITEEQTNAFRGVQWAEDSYCHPVLDGLGRWVISLQEMIAIGVSCEVVEWVEPEKSVSDGLELQ